VGITVGDGVITVSLRAVAADEEAAEELVRRDVCLLEERFGDLLFGRGETTLARAVSYELERTGRTVAVAESVTGGLIGDMLVDVPGISRFFLADVVAYSNEAKVRQLQVPAELIEQHGAVSPQVAEAMAKGTRHVAGADLGLSTTGIAGPTGGTPEKPVGLVYVGLSLGEEAAVREFHLRGDRWRVKDRAARHALNLARLALRNGLESTA
jgi:nicotinamide-nucleotide amidase